jgi:hypothetical protein
MKKLILTLLVVGLVLYATSAFAGWGNYDVVSTGPYESSAFPAVGQIMSVQLKPIGGGAAIYYRIKANVANELLAVSLTALSNGNPVRANIEYNYANGHWSDYEVITIFIYDSVASLP